MLDDLSTCGGLVSDYDKNVKRRTVSLPNDVWKSTLLYTQKLMMEKCASIRTDIQLYKDDWPICIERMGDR